jgi:hypothetical protein
MKTNNENTYHIESEVWSKMDRTKSTEQNW